MTGYRWNAHQGPDPAALHRLKEYFCKPNAPMGEAWFMSDERRLYTELMLPLSEWPEKALDDALAELASGPTCFGYRDEWTAWVRYLLPYVVEMGEDVLEQRFSSLASAVMVHWMDAGNAKAEGYAGFCEDLLATLGRGLCGAHFRMQIDATAYGNLLRSDGAFSALNSLVAKYVPIDQMAGWLKSVALVEEPAWRASWVRWLHLAAPLLLQPDSQPADLAEKGASWCWCWSVTGSCPGRTVDADARVIPFMGADRQRAFADGVRNVVDIARLEHWREALDGLQYHLDVDLAGALAQYDESVPCVIERWRLRG